MTNIQKLRLGARPESALAGQDAKGRQAGEYLLMDEQKSGNFITDDLLSNSQKAISGQQQCEIYSTRPRKMFRLLRCGFGRPLTSKSAGKSARQAKPGFGSKLSVNFVMTWLRKFPSRSKRIDVISRIFFPLMFALFNLVYWTTYLFRDDDIVQA